MRVFFANRFFKILTAAVIFSVLSVPMIPLSCRAMVNTVRAGHECCQKDLCNAKISRPPCCESCRTAAPRTATTAPQVSISYDLVPVMMGSTLHSADFNLRRFDKAFAESSSHSPPLYLSFKTFLC